LGDHLWKSPFGGDEQKVWALGHVESGYQDASG
jgi:hypothetical protein